MRSLRRVAAFVEVSPVTGHPSSLVEQLHGGGAQARIELAFDQGVGHRVVMAFYLHMDIGRHAHLAPLGVDIRFSRERLEGRAVDFLVVRAPRAGQLFKRSVV